MIKKVIFISSLILSSTTVKAATGESDGQINFIGGFLSSPCTIDINGDSQPANVNLGWWNTSNFTTPGLDTDFVPINITLTNCPDEIKDSTANVIFKGDTVSENSDYYKVSNSTLENLVGVGLYSEQDSSKIIKPNVRDLKIELNGDSGSKTIYAAYKTFGKTEGGEANSSITFDISYN